MHLDRRRLGNDLDRIELAHAHHAAGVEVHRVQLDALRDRRARAQQAVGLGAGVFKLGDVGRAGARALQARRRERMADADVAGRITVRQRGAAEGESGARDDAADEA